MKHSRAIPPILGILVFCFAVSIQAQYYQYYREGGTFALAPVDSVLTIRISAAHPELSPADLAVAVTGIGFSDADARLPSGFYRYEATLSTGLDSLLDYLRSLPEIDIANPCFRLGENSIMCMTDQILARFSSGLSRSAIDSTMSAMGLRFRDPDPSVYARCVILCAPGSATNTLRTSLDLIEDGICTQAEPNYVFTNSKMFVPNDWLYPQQWYLNNPDPLYPDAHIAAEKAWEITRGSEDVIVAVIDDGFQFTHPDFAGLERRQEWDVIGADYEYPSPDNSAVNDCLSALCAHGTAVLGLISARMDNDSIGIAGLAPGCTVMPIKCFDRDGKPTSETSIDAVEYLYSVADTPHVASCSWGTPYSSFMEDALDSAYHAGITVFFSAGHRGGGGNSAPMEYPGWSQWVIGVGETDNRDRWLKGFPAGDSLDISAPSGSPMWSLDLMGLGGYNPGPPPPFGGDDCDPFSQEDDDYTCTMGGTSAATPLAAGVAALVYSRRPDLLNVPDPVAQMREILYNSADDLGNEGLDSLYGHGRANAFRALVAVSRGDLNSDGVPNVFDVAFAAREIFREGCPDSLGYLHRGLSDANCDSVKDVLDIVKIADAAFRSGPWPDPCYIFDYDASSCPQ